MAVGLPAKTTYVDGDVFSASDINDTNGTLNLVGQTTNFYAGKNKIINGDFGIWQRGTSTSIPANGIAFVSDRWKLNVDNLLGGSAVVSRQSFTPGTAPVAGYEGVYYCQIANTAGSSASRFFWQNIENVQTFAGQTVTLSFWAKASAATSIDVKYQQNFGSGGSSAVNGAFNNATSLTTSWQRFSYSVTLPSISGKTVGSSSYIYVLFTWLNTVSTTIDFWGVQLEAGSTATAFQTATGTIQGELAACQRYYIRTTGSNEALLSSLGYSYSSSVAAVTMVPKVTMRVIPTAVDYSNVVITDQNGTTGTVSALVISTKGFTQDYISLTATTGATLGSGNRPFYAAAQPSVTGFIGLSAEL
jgi:hypothetical protein